MATMVVDLELSGDKTVFFGSSEEDMAYAKTFWQSVQLLPPMESRLVSSDIKQRLKVAPPGRQCEFLSWSKRPHSKIATPRTATTLLVTKTATSERPHLSWSKRPRGISAKTAIIYLVKTATEGSLQNRPHFVCLFVQNGHRRRITGKITTLFYLCLF